MQLELFKQFYQSRHLSDADYLKAEQILTEAQTILFPDGDLDEINEETLDGIIAHFHNQSRLDIPVMIVFLRYFRLIKRHDLYIRLTQYTGGLGVIEAIIERGKKYLGEQTNILGTLTIPPLGTTPQALSLFTAKFIDHLQASYDEEVLKLILAGNNHGLPESAFAKEKQYYQASLNLETYLKDLHQRKVAELTEHFEEKKVWFEQEVTEEMIAFVKSNQEILAGVLKDDYLYQTKIPYDTNRYLSATTQAEKAYYACHCPFARATLQNQKQSIPPVWCYCSAGFEKFPFEVILGRTLPVKVLKSVLNKDNECRFAIDLRQVDYKK